MDIYLPIAELSASAPLLLFIGVLVGILSGTFGVGGSFLAMPMLLYSGIPSSIAVATQACLLVASSSSGTLTHFKRGTLDSTLAFLMFFGSLLGLFLGHVLMEFLSHFGYSDLVVNLLYIVLLGSVGSMMMKDALFPKIVSVANTGTNTPSAFSLFVARLPLPSFLKTTTLLPSLGREVATATPLFIGSISGLMISLLGVGAGFLLVPMLVYWVQVPARFVSGTVLFQIGLTACVSVLFSALTTNKLDILLCLPLMVGAALGTSLGFRVAKYMSPRWGRVIFAGLILLAVLLMVLRLVVEPDITRTLMLETG